MRRLLVVLTILAAMLVPAPASAAAEITINEIALDGPGTDALEFVEIAGPPGMALDGYRLIFFNGNAAPYSAYRSVRLFGQRLSPTGYLVVGSGGVDNVGLVAWRTDGIQNAGARPDAVAIYRGDANPTTPTTVGLVDVVVYGATDYVPFRSGFGSPPLRTPGSTDGSIGMTASGWTASLRPTPGRSNDTLRFSEIAPSSAIIELAGVAGASLAGVSIASYTRDGKLFGSLDLAGSIQSNGLLIVGAPAVPDAPYAIALVRGSPPQTVSPSFVDLAVIGTEDVAWRATVGAQTLEASSAALARIGSLAARLQPAVLTPGAANTALPVVVTPTPVGTLRGFTHGSYDTPAWYGREARVVVRVTAVVRATTSEVLLSVQDDGDGLATTSDGIIARWPTASPQPQPGTRLSVRGIVDVRDGRTELNTLTEIVQSGPDPIPASVPIAFSDLASQDGMRVVADAFVAGPRQRDAAGNFDLAIRNDADPAAPIRVLGLPGVEPPAVDYGQALTALSGVLVAGEIYLETVGGEVPGRLPGDPLLPNDRANLFSVATYNVENFFDAHDDPADPNDNLNIPYVPSNVTFYRQRLNKLANHIKDGLLAPDVLILQEIEDQDLCTGGGQAYGTCGTTNNADGVNDILADIVAAVLDGGSGIEYLIHAKRDVADERGILTAVLIRADRVSLLPVIATDPVFGARTDTTNYPSNGQVVNPKVLRARASNLAALDGDGADLYTRPPLALNLRITGLPNRLVVIANHFKSDPSDFSTRRTEQVAFVAGLAKSIQTADPSALVIVAGDFNADRGNAQLGPLPQNLAPITRDAGLYSYRFDGVTELIDQIYGTQNLAARLETVSARHVNTYFNDLVSNSPATPNGASDHDPVIAFFRFAEPPVLPYGLSVPAGMAPAG